MTPTIYLSYFLDEKTPIYGGHVDKIRLKTLKSMEQGDSCNEHSLELPAHAGTHIDLPNHFDAHGKNLNHYAADFWIFRSVSILECEPNEAISRISALPSNTDLLLLKTGFGRHRKEKKYWESQPVVPAELADQMRAQMPGLRAFGMDLISVSSRLDRETGREAHRRFLRDQGIILIEDMNLEALSTRPIRVTVAPLLVSGADGVPCTVIAEF